MQAPSGGGFIKKALGLVFMATVMNNTGLITGSNDQESVKNIVKLARQAAPTLLGI
jgi:hypothetical protein